MTPWAVRQPAHWTLGVSDTARDYTLGWAAGRKSAAVFHTRAQGGIIAGVSPLATSAFASHATRPAGANGMLQVT